MELICTTNNHDSQILENTGAYVSMHSMTDAKHNKQFSTAIIINQDALMNCIAQLSDIRSLPRQLSAADTSIREIEDVVMSEPDTDDTACEDMVFTPSKPECSGQIPVVAKDLASAPPVVTFTASAQSQTHLPNDFIVALDSELDSKRKYDQFASDSESDSESDYEPIPFPKRSRGSCSEQYQQLLANRNGRREPRSLKKYVNLPIFLGRYSKEPDEKLHIEDKRLDKVYQQGGGTIQYSRQPGKDATGSFVRKDPVDRSRYLQKKRDQLCRTMRKIDRRGSFTGSLHRKLRHLTAVKSMSTPYVTDLEPIRSHDSVCVPGSNLG